MNERESFKNERLHPDQYVLREGLKYCQQNFYFAADSNVPTDASNNRVEDTEYCIWYS
jgi:hypothetical protein